MDHGGNCGGGEHLGTLRCMGTPFWLAFASLLVSIIVGGSGLAIAILGYRSNREAIGDAWAREWAAQRPVVYPLVVDRVEDWDTLVEVTPITGEGLLHLLPVKNGGRGPALNVRGTLTAPPGDGEEEHQLLGTTIAAGDLLNMRIVPPLSSPLDESAADIHGTITYRDLAGSTWEQHFTFRRNGAGAGMDLELAEPIQHLGEAGAAAAPSDAGSPGETAPRPPG